MSEFSIEDRQLIEDSAVRFVDAHYPFEERKRRLEQTPYGANWKEFAKLGWLAMSLAEESGGLGAGIGDVQVLMKAFGRGLVEEPYFEAIVVAARLLEKLGTDEQRQTLNDCIAGETRLCLAHRENGSELNPDAIETTARKGKKGFLLNGRKNAVYAAGWADTLLVSAVCDGSPSLFLVPADAPGLTLDLYPTVDSREAGDIALADVGLSVNARLGHPESETWPVFKSVLLQAMAALCGEAAGIARELLKQTGEYLQSREQFGTPLAQFQALQHRFADMAIVEMEISAAASLAANAADAIDEAGAEPRIRSAKVRIGQLGRRLGEEAVQLHGGIGVTEELVIGHYLRRLLAIDNLLGNQQEHLVWLARQKEAA